MNDEYTCSGWACVDCLMEIANGESPADLSEDEIAARDAEISARNAGYRITLGLPREQHSCTEDFGGKVAYEVGAECDCETNEFSWSACDVCGSNLGGERHAVSFWKITDLT